MALLAIFRSARYLSFTVVSTALVFFFMSVFPQRALLGAVLSAREITFFEKVHVIFAIPYGVLTEASLASVMVFVIAMLFSISVAGTLYYLRLYRASVVSLASAFGAGGIVSGVLALGCLACGSLAVALLASFFSTSSLLLFLLQDLLLGAISIMMLCVSLYLLNTKLKSV